MKLRDKLWNWGHLEGSHNDCALPDCKMTPEEFAREYGIPNAFIVSYAGNIQPPFDHFARRFSCLREVKWSVLGDSSTPLPDAELGNTDDILDVLVEGCNITGGVVDDFFSKERMERFTPEVLKKIKDRLNSVGRDFWCVLYHNQLDNDLEKYLDCFDGITFWVWGCQKNENMELYLEKLFTLARGKRIMLGVYLWDYGGPKSAPMDTDLFKKQLDICFDLLKRDEIEGIIFCSSTIGDADLETNRILKEYVRQFGDIEI